MSTSAHRARDTAARRGGLDVDLSVTLDAFGLQVELSVAPGEVVALLGPNGAGKTTLLRALAGLQPLSDGRIELAGDVLEDVRAHVRRPPAQRDIGMVFQEHLLFPHLSAVENVAFGPRADGRSRTEARQLATTWLTQVGLGDRLSARPRELSGGQAARVALARALARDPALLLLDEPLAALDVATRQQVRAVLRAHLGSFDGPALIVTHEPLEAIMLADRLVVLENGRVVQDDQPARVTARPRTAWVAELVGVNLLRGHARGTEVDLEDGTVLHVADPAQGAVHVVVHPRAISLHRHPPEGSPRNVLVREVTGLEVRGDHVRVALGPTSGRAPERDVGVGGGGPGPGGGSAGPGDSRPGEGGTVLVAEVTSAAVAELDLATGGTVHAAIKAVEITIHPVSP